MTDPQIEIQALKTEKTADAARRMGSLGKFSPETRIDAIEGLSNIIQDETIESDIRRTATVELGSIAARVNSTLTFYVPDIDEKESVAEVINLLSVLENGVYPQVARYVGPIVMDTKSPQITKEGLKILLKSDHDESAQKIDEILDTKEGYVLQKLQAVTKAVVEIGPENINPKIAQSIRDYIADISPHIARRIAKDIEETGLVTQSFRTLAKKGFFPEEEARALRELYHTINTNSKELPDSEYFDFSHLDQKEAEEMAQQEQEHQQQQSDAGSNRIAESPEHT